MVFLTTAIFRDSLRKLIRKNNIEYSSCEKDIWRSFDKQSFRDIYIRQSLLEQRDQLRYIKIRLRNSKLNLGSVEGYRLIICCNPEARHIAFLDIYPKLGKHGKSGISQYKLGELIKIYLDELKSGSLKEFPRTVLILLFLYLLFLSYFWRS